ncbi:MAG TPA: DUF2510 domain-containing protein [Mycobacteriales bacterium]|nr:DUF2510 domain-containing protein [Mycobacteriales bacterium]
MTEARPPGWYDEPGGDRASLRWWDGRSWTSVTRSRSRFEQLADPAPAATDLLDSDTVERPPGNRRGWLIAGLAAAVVLVLVVVGLPGRDDEGGLADPLPGPGPATIVPSEPPPITPTPVSGRVQDRVARLSYDVLPGTWREWDRDSFDGLESTLGYYRVTQQNAPLGQTYWANVNSGPLDPDTTGNGDLAGAAQRLIDTLAQEYYPKHSRQGFSQKSLTVDGAKAYLVRYRAIFDPAAAAGYSAKSEQIVVLVVDTGQSVPSALYVSLPDTVSDLWPSIDGLLARVKVIR